VQFASVGVKMWVCGQATGKGATEIGARDSFQSTVDMYREVAVFNQRQPIPSGLVMQ
jgi:hypothetical protein